MVVVYPTLVMTRGLVSHVQNWRALPLETMSVLYTRTPSVSIVVARKTCQPAPVACASLEKCFAHGGLRTMESLVWNASSLVLSPVAALRPASRIETGAVKRLLHAVQRVEFPAQHAHPRVEFAPQHALPRVELAAQHDVQRVEPAAQHVVQRVKDDVFLCAGAVWRRLY